MFLFLPGAFPQLILLQSPLGVSEEKPELSVEKLVSETSNPVFIRLRLKIANHLLFIWPSEQSENFLHFIVKQSGFRQLEPEKRRSGGSSGGTLPVIHRLF